MEPLDRFAELRDRARRERIGEGGPTLCAALTAAVDDVVRDLGRRLPPNRDVALVAIGGYGREEQCLYSDIDLMLLHGGGEVDELAAAVFRPLWDARLKVGHSVRTPAEAGAAARQHFETLTSLLSARLVAGSSGLFGSLRQELAAVVKGKPLASQLAAAERERRSLDPYPVMAADLKEGRGGLRTLQGLDWERRRAALLGITAEPPTENELEARAILLTIRNGLHAVTGRPHNIFSVELREPVARWMGRHPRVAAGMLTSTLAFGDRLAERTWPDVLTVADDPLGAFRRRTRRIRSRFQSSTPEPPATTPLTVAKRALDRPGRVAFADDEARTVREPAGPWTAADRTAFVAMIGAGDRGRAAFDLLDDLGWVDRDFPEWRLISAAPQLAPFHEHPVDAHLWRSVDEMRRIVEGPEEEYRQIADEVDSTEELVLAAFFHDIGKGRGGDHSKVGAALVRAFCARAGFGPATASAVEHAARHHLLLSEVATRRDINSSKVIDDVVDAVGSLRRLQVLYLLSVADARATGPSMWTTWKATLLRSLYVRCAARFGADGFPDDAVPPAPIEPYLEAAAGHEPRMVEEHLAAMPDDYLSAYSPEDVAWHLDVLAGSTARPDVAVRGAPAGSEVLVVGEDMPGFLAALATVFAANGVDVLEARLFTRADGVVVDRFVVTSDRRAEPIPDARWDRIRGDLAGIVAGTLDLQARVDERTRAYAKAAPPASPTVVQVAEEESGLHTVVTVRCPDRVGRLAQIVGALRDADCDIDYAKLDVRGSEVIDTFFVRRNTHPIRDPDERDALAASVAAALDGAHRA